MMIGECRAALLSGPTGWTDVDNVAQPNKTPRSPTRLPTQSQLISEATRSSTGRYVEHCKRTRACFQHQCSKPSSSSECWQHDLGDYSASQN